MVNGGVFTNKEELASTIYSVKLGSLVPELYNWKYVNR